MIYDFKNEDLEFAMLDIMTQNEFTFSKEDLGL